MLFGVISGRAYAVIAICVAAILGAIAYFDGMQGSGQLGSFFRDIAADARPFLGGTIADFIFQPFVLVFTNIYWAIGAGLLWPVIILWVIFFLVGLGATLIGPALTEIDNV